MDGMEATNDVVVGLTNVAVQRPFLITSQSTGRSVSQSGRQQCCLKWMLRCYKVEEVK